MEFRTEHQDKALRLKLKGFKWLPNQNMCILNIFGIKSIKCIPNGFVIGNVDVKQEQNMRNWRSNNNNNTTARNFARVPILTMLWK